jgi:hypothetical protein
MPHSAGESPGCTDAWPRLLTPAPELHCVSARHAKALEPTSGVLFAQHPRQMRSFSSISSRGSAARLLSHAGAAGMSEARGWRWPTGAGSGLERVAPEAGGAGLSSGGFCAQAVPAMAAARAAGATAHAALRREFQEPDKTCSAF